MAPGLGVSLALPGVPADVLLKRLRMQEGDIGTVAQDPVTGLRILQRRHRPVGLNVVFLEHRLVNDSRKAVDVRSLAVADYTFAPPPPPAKPPRVKPSPVTVYGLSASLQMLREPITAEKAVALGPKDALGMFVVADEYHAGGIVLAVAGEGPWRLTGRLDKAGRLRLRLEVLWDDQTLSLAAGESLRLPPVALAAYWGRWRAGAGMLRQMWLRANLSADWNAVRKRAESACYDFTTRRPHARALGMLARANFFLPAEMLPCRIPTPPADLRGEALDTYFRCYLPGVWGDQDAAKDLPRPARQALDRAAEVRAAVRPLLGDQFHRILFGGQKDDPWEAVQFHSRLHAAGVVLVFRQGAPQPKRDIPLRGLKPHMPYRVWVAGEKTGARVLGQAMMTKGLTVTLPKSGSRIIRYQAGR
jgi:hypothetical protein